MTQTRNYVMQFSPEAGQDVAWTPHVIIRTILESTEINNLLREGEMGADFDLFDGVEIDVAEVIEVWERKLQVKDPKATIEEAHYLFAPFAE